MQQPQAIPSILRFRLINWFYKQLYPEQIIHTFVVLGMCFGLISGSWLFGLPLLIAYSLYVAIFRKTEIPGWFAHHKNNFFIFKYLNELKRAENAQEKKRIKKQFYKNLGESLGLSGILSSPKLLKVLFTIYLLFNTNNLVGFLSLYCLYRVSFDHWKNNSLSILNKIYNFLDGVKKGAIRRKPFKKELILLAFITLCSAFLLSVYGLFLIADLALSSLIVSMSFLGFKAVLVDMAHIFREPIKYITMHPGKFYGLLWGRAVAHSLFPGNVMGSMGPAYGTVETGGIFSSLFSPILGSSNWFTFQTSLTSLLTSRINAGFTYITSSLFYSHSMNISGHFHGTIGPTSFQIYIGMAFGCLVGLYCERLARHLMKRASIHGEEISHTLYSPVGRIFDRLYRSRWEIGFISGIAPLVLYSPGGASILALVGGNMVVAGGVIAATTAATLFSIYTARNLVKNVGRRILGRSEEPVRPAGPAPQPEVDAAHEVIAIDPPIAPAPQAEADAAQDIARPATAEDEPIAPQPAPGQFTPLFTAGQQAPASMPTIVITPPPEPDNDRQLHFAG